MVIDRLSLFHSVKEPTVDWIVGFLNNCYVVKIVLLLILSFRSGMVISELITEYDL